MGNDVKKSLLPILNEKNFTPLKTKNSKVFAYTIGDLNKRVLVVGNLNFNENEKATVIIPKYKKETILPIKVTQVPVIKHGKIQMNLQPGEIVVLILN